MTRHLPRLLASCVLALPGAAAPSADAPPPAAPVTLAQLPEPVRRQIESQAKGVEIDHIDKQVSDQGAVTYAAYVPRSGKLAKLVVDDQGRLLSTTTVEPLSGPAAPTDVK
jgi:hypothetical protein